MTEEAVREQFEFYVEEFADTALDAIELDNVEVASRMFLPEPDGIPTPLQSAAEHIIPTQLERIQERLDEQFGVVIDYARARADGEDPDLEAYFDTFKKQDIFYERAKGNANDLEEELRGRFKSLAEDMEPLIDSDHDNFWTAVSEEYGAEEARKKLESHFSYSAVVDEYSDVLDFSHSACGYTVSFEDELLRVMECGEEYVSELIDEEIEEVYPI